MEKKYYTTEIGAIQVKCGDSCINISNGFGDGSFKTYHFDNYSEFNTYIKEHYKNYGIDENKYYFITTCYFKKAKVLYEPLYRNYEQELDQNYVLFELTGLYSIYNLFGKVYFVKMGD